jgi:hypothetical protein
MIVPHIACLPEQRIYFERRPHLSSTAIRRAAKRLLPKDETWNAATEQRQSTKTAPLRRRFVRAILQNDTQNASTVEMDLQLDPL